MPDPTIVKIWLPLEGRVRFRHHFFLQHCFLFSLSPMLWHTKAVLEDITVWIGTSRAVPIPLVFFKPRNTEKIHHLIYFMIIHVYTMHWSATCVHLCMCVWVSISSSSLLLASITSKHVLMCGTGNHFEFSQSFTCQFLFHISVFFKHYTALILIVAIHWRAIWSWCCWCNLSELFQKNISISKWESILPVFDPTHNPAHNYGNRKNILYIVGTQTQ